MVAALLGLLLGTGLITVLLTAAALLEGIAVPELLSNLGRARQLGLPINEAAVVLEHAIFIVYVVSCIVLALAFMRFNFASDVQLPDDLELANSLREEFRGRLASSMGYILGEVSTDKDKLVPIDMDRLNEAVELCEKGYRVLDHVGGAARYMALNNFVYFVTFIDDVSRRGYILDLARELKIVGQTNNLPNLILTYCRAVLVYGDDQGEIEEVRSILSHLAKGEIRESLRKEAKVYLASISMGARRV